MAIVPTVRLSTDSEEHMPDIELSIETRERAGWSVLDVAGEVDLYTASKLKEQLRSLSDRGKHRIVVNLERVGFIDSTALGVLIGALKRAREHEGEVVLAAPAEPVRKVLSITGLERVFPIRDGVEEATGG
jgi:anti-sigma B factor antagonist